MIVTLQSRNTVTIPLEIRRQLDLEPGAPLEASIEGGRLVLAPVAVVPRALRLTKSGEAKEAEADRDLEEGRVTMFETAEELLEELRSRSS